jgi:hypothetical protein
MKWSSLGEVAVSVVAGAVSWLVPLQIEESYVMLAAIAAVTGTLFGGLQYVRHRERWLASERRFEGRRWVAIGTVFALALAAYYGIKTNTLTESWPRAYGLGAFGSVLCFMLAAGFALYSNGLIRMIFKDWPPKT